MNDGLAIIGSGAACAVIGIALYVWVLLGVARDGSVTEFYLAAAWPVPILAGIYGYLWAIQY